MKELRRGDVIKQNGKDIEVMISAPEIRKIVLNMAKRIKDDFQNEIGLDQELLLVGILKGVVPFYNDLGFALNRFGIHKLKSGFVSSSSYGMGQESSAKPVISTEDIKKLNIRGRHVLLIDEMADTRFSMKDTSELMRIEEPAHLWMAVLLNKEKRRRVSFNINYIGRDIDDFFAVGYGLDSAEEFRFLRFIGKVR